MRRLTFFLGLVMGVLVAGSTHAAGIDEQLATLNAVGPEGAGSAAARDAWRQLTTADVNALPTILAALDKASPLGANWMRSSFDTIAERQLRSGGKLPTASLEKFTTDTRHSNRARRLAFEWLCRADATAADRLIPKMLDDPSVEFRRDAVVRVLSTAEAFETDGKPKEAAAAYRQALNSARDLDQVQQIVKKLDSFGDKVDVAAHFGYVLRWRLIGPFDNTKESGFDVDYPPEKSVEFAAECPGKAGPVKWIDSVTEDPYGKVDLNKALNKENSVVAYAAAEFLAEKAGPVEVRLQTTNANKIWLNGVPLAANKVYHAGSQMDQYVGRGNLKAGRNIILLKICQNEQPESWAQDWDFQCRVCDAVGTAVLSGDRRSQTNAPVTR